MNVDSAELPDVRAAEAALEGRRRRTVAVISHPDAGKSTLTEALLLHAEAIAEAGAVHGKQRRRATVSDWMEMEKRRGISVSSAAISFEHRGTQINLVDTPGHADFSEDTYRVLSAVDSVIMLIDAAKGIESQTMKLFEVCRARDLPVITVINKWDRPGRDALSLLDEVLERTGMLPVPLTWPIGVSGHLRATLETRTGDAVMTRPTAPGALPVRERLEPAKAAVVLGDDWREARDELDLQLADAREFRRDEYLAGLSSPVVFAAALRGVGVREVLDLIVDESPPALPRIDDRGEPRDIGASFAAQVFKVQSGMDPAHRDRLAFVRICSGVFERGMVVQHSQSGRPFATKYAQQVFGQQRSTVELAWPGDIVGLVNASNLRPGDTLFVDEPTRFPPLPRFSPEHFRVATSVDTGRHKQFRRGIEQLDQEGVVQVLRSERRGDQAPILAAVGPMQFEVAAERMEHEYGAALRLSELPYAIVRRTDADGAARLERIAECETAVRGDGAILALFPSEWRLGHIVRTHPDLLIEPIDGAPTDSTAKQRSLA